MKGLKKKWGIDSNFQLLIILLVFAITGLLALRLAKPVLLWLGVEKASLSPWFFWPARVFIIFPIYQVIILVVGSLFGQFKFFWDFEKKMLVRLGFKKFFNQ